MCFESLRIRVLGNSKVVEIEGEYWVFLDFEKNVVYSKGSKFGGKRIKLRPLRMNQIAVCNRYKVVILATGFGDRSVRNWNGSRACRPRIRARVYSHVINKSAESAYPR